MGWWRRRAWWESSSVLEAEGRRWDGRCGGHAWRARGRRRVRVAAQGRCTRRQSSLRSAFPVSFGSKKGPAAASENPTRARTRAVISPGCRDAPQQVRKRVSLRVGGHRVRQILPMQSGEGRVACVSIVRLLQAAGMASRRTSCWHAGSGSARCASASRAAQKGFL